MPHVLKILWTGGQAGSLSAKPRVALAAPSSGQYPHLSSGLPFTVPLSRLPPSLGVGFYIPLEAIGATLQVRCLHRSL